jgi:hypothetical protein
MKEPARIAGKSASDAPGPTGPGQGKKDTTLQTGVHRSIPNLAAAAMAERRLFVFKTTLKSAAARVSLTQNPDSLHNFSIGTAAARKAVMFLESAECNHYRSVLKASARGKRRVS